MSGFVPWDFSLAGWKMGWQISSNLPDAPNKYGGAFGATVF